MQMQSFLRPETYILEIRIKKRFPPCNDKTRMRKGSMICTLLCSELQVEETHTRLKADLIVLNKSFGMRNLE